MYNNTKEKRYIKKSIIKKKGLVYIMKRRKISENVLEFMDDIFWVQDEEDITLDILVASIDICKMLIKHNENEDYVDNLINVLEGLEELLELKLCEND